MQAGKTSKGTSLEQYGLAFGGNQADIQVAEEVVVDADADLDVLDGAAGGDCDRATHPLRRSIWNGNSSVILSLDILGRWWGGGGARNLDR